MVVEVFVAQSNAKNTLSQHRLLVMDYKERVARIGNATMYGIDKADTLVNFSKQHRTGVGGKAAAVEISVIFFGTHN